ncbi:MAG: RibD family protein, partial [Elusimicrobiota bacterium]|nr:RibD family protein [Elusimicrobiota bacterium]
ETLKSAGIEVFSGLCKTRAKLLLKDFLAHLKLKPKVCIKVAMSLDGKIATKTFDSKWISSLKSRKMVHEMRSHFDAVLIGKNTALKDNPILSSHGAGRNPARVVVDFDLSLPKNYHLLDGTIPTFFVCSQKIKNIPDYYKGINKNLVFVDEAAAKKDFNVIIKKLNLLNIKTILIEGGGEIIYSALFSHAVDECFFFVAPIILGGKNAVSVAGGLGADKVKEAVKFKDIKVSKIGGDILIKAKAEKKCSLE